MATFGDIRSILEREPGLATWWELCVMLEEYDGAEPLAERVVPYCEAKLARWPSSTMRGAPRSWIERLVAGERFEPIMLANTLQLALDVDRADELLALAASPLLGGVDTLMWGESFATRVGSTPDDSFDRRIFDAADAHAHAMARLEDAMDVFFDAFASRVRRVSLGSKRMGIELFERVGSMPRIERLIVDEMPGDLESIDRIAALAFPRLERLELRVQGPMLLLGRDHAPWMEGLRTIGILEGMSGADVARLAEHEWLAGLERLELRLRDVGPHEMYALLVSPTWSGLRELVLDDSTFALDAARLERRVFSHATLSSLELLSLRRAFLQPDVRGAFESFGGARGVRVDFGSFGLGVF